MKFSVKFVFFHEKRLFPWNPWFLWILTLYFHLWWFQSFISSIWADQWRSTVLSLDLVFIHVVNIRCSEQRAVKRVCVCVWVFVVQKFQMYHSTTFLLCISTAPLNNICGAHEFLKLLPWIFREIFSATSCEITHSSPWIRLVPKYGPADATATHCLLLQ